MKVFHQDNLYKIARITGPQHNFLGVRIGVKPGSIIYTCLPEENVVSARVNEEYVSKQIDAALGVAAEVYGIPFYVSEVQFLASDSQSKDAYKIMMLEICKFIANSR
ncbi:hypothetical protein V8J88_24470 [Massilia sp. W12]|uniref:hypothetical protein n=1 Tax=Massilia sp. W12 TaxID=3126507 RepID=UPI0030CE27F1